MPVGKESILRAANSTKSTVASSNKEKPVETTPPIAETKIPAVKKKELPFYLL